MTFLVSENLEGVEFDDQQKRQYDEISKNILQIIIGVQGHVPIIGNLRYFRVEESSIILETQASMTPSLDLFVLLNNGHNHIDLLEIHRGEEPIYSWKSLKVVGHSIADTEPLNAMLTFGLKLNIRDKTVI